MNNGPRRRTTTDESVKEQKLNHLLRLFSLSALKDVKASNLVLHKRSSLLFTTSQRIFSI